MSGGDELKKLDLGQSIGILANVGVIEGIVFLGFELRQNNELMEAEARMATHQGGQEFALSLAQNPALTSVLAKVSRDEPLSEAEEIQVYALGLFILRTCQGECHEMVRGALSAEDNSAESWRVLFHANRLDYRLDETWDMAKRQLDSDLVSFFEENVVNRPVE